MPVDERRNRDRGEHGDPDQDRDEWRGAPTRLGVMVGGRVAFGPRSRGFGARPGLRPGLAIALAVAAATAGGAARVLSLVFVFASGRGRFRVPAPRMVFIRHGFRFRTASRIGMLRLHAAVGDAVAAGAVLDFARIAAIRLSTPGDHSKCQQNQH